MYLLDTNVVTALRARRSNNENVWSWAAEIAIESQLLSAITVFELEYGIQLIEHRNAAQGAVYRRWLVDTVWPMFAGRILPVDTAIATKAAGLHVPYPMGREDALIASTALVHDLTVVTRNIKDFERTGVRTLNPWLLP
jgi:toxin FitB